MDDVRVGSVFRAVRIRRGLRQFDVATSAGVSQTVVSTIETGDVESVSLRSLRSVAAALGISLPFEPRWRGADLAKLLDEKHAGMVDDFVRGLTQLGWIVLPEHTFNIRGERGSIDVLAWRPVDRAVLATEVKTVVVDLQDLLATLDRKRRLLGQISRELGWGPLKVGTLLLMPEETQARHAVDRFRSVFDVAYPERGRGVQRWLRCPDRDMRGVLFLPNSGYNGTKRRPGGSRRVRAKRPTPKPEQSRSAASDARGVPAGRLVGAGRAPT
jgi:transcriptional regulator with XRE-family HTH domain